MELEMKKQSIITLLQLCLICWQNNGLPPPVIGPVHVYHFFKLELGLDFKVNFLNLIEGVK